MTETGEREGVPIHATLVYEQPGVYEQLAYMGSRNDRCARELSDPSSAAARVGLRGEARTYEGIAKSMNQTWIPIGSQFGARRVVAAAVWVASCLAFASSAIAAGEPLVGNIADFSGRTANVSRPYSQAKIDAVAWINAHGGIAGQHIKLDTVDYAYEVPRAIKAYQKWLGEGLVAVQGWGTADTEALSLFASEDHIPYFSASFSARLTDPLGKGPETIRPSPYNFVMGPTYSDGVRGLLRWAKADWKARGETGEPSFVHMGDNHPYPNAPKKAGETYAQELGFRVLPSIRYSLAPGDFRGQCLELRQSGANYAFLANTSDSNLALLKTCAEVGVQTQFMANIWGADENLVKAAGKAANGLVWVMGAAPWSSDVTGMALVHDIARAADPKVEYQPIHYVRGICSMFFMKEAMDWAAKNGGITGPNIKQGMYQKQNWVPQGLEGVCPPGTWSADDHRGITDVLIYRAKVNGTPSPETPMSRLLADKTIVLEPAFSTQIERKPEWLGW